jgi:serine/threonine protein kinase
MNDFVGKQLGNYRVLRLLGQGGFADVYLAEHIYLKTEAAIKVLNARLTSDDLEVFLKEARTISSLVHSHIVRVLEFGVEGNTPFLVMDYAPNGTLRQKHPKGSRLPLSIILPYVTQVAAALQYAHDRRLIHRDVKPENMLLNRNNEVLLSDFGIALLSQSSRYQNTQDVVGTIGYMAPEQLMGKPTAASDQYALAIAVFEWLSGERPFHGSFAEVASQHMLAPVPSLTESIPGLPSSINDVLQIALAKDPQSRFLRVEAFASALSQAAGIARSPQSTPPMGSVQLEQAILPDASTLLFNKGVANQSRKDLPVSPADAASSTYIVNRPGHAPVPIGTNNPANMVQTGPILPLSPNADHSQSARKGISRRAVIVGLIGLVALAAVAGGGAVIASDIFLHQPNGTPKTSASIGSSQHTATAGNTPAAPTDTPTSTPSATGTPVATETATANASTPTATVIPAGTTLYTADWSSGLNGWVGSSAWKVSAGLLLSDGTQNNGLAETLIVCPYSVSVADYQIEAQIQILRQSVESGYGGSMGLFIRGDGQNNGYFVGDSDFSVIFVDVSSSNGSYINQLKTVSYSPDLNNHTFLLQAQGNTITLSIDGGKYLSISDNTYISGGQVGVFAANDEIEVRSFKVIAL